MIKRDISLYLVTQDLKQYRLPIYNDVRYSQAFSEVELKNKTLHSQETLISGGFTSKLAAGNFQFTIPVMDSISARALFTLIFENVPQSFSLFFQENGNSVSLNRCVVSGVTFNITKDAIITASISGEYSNSVSAPLIGTPQLSFGSLYTYIEGIGIELNGVSIPNITTFSIEMSNNIGWVDNQTMHDSGPRYPTEFYTSEKIISGNFTKNDELNIPSFFDSVPLRVQIKSNNSIFLDFDFDSVISTTRPQLDEIIKKGFDFRITSNSNEIKYKGVNIL